MKHILDSSFRYKPSFDTDVKKTFERIRKEQQKKDADAAKIKAEAQQNVKPLIKARVA